MAQFQLLCSLPVNGSPVLVRISPEANPGTRIHVYVAYAGGGPCQHLLGSGQGRRGGRDLRLSSSRRVLRVCSKADWLVSSIPQGRSFLLKVRDSLGDLDVSGKPPNMGPGCQGTEQGMNSQRAATESVVSVADFHYPLLLRLVISSQVKPVTTQDLHSTSLLMKLEAGCFRFVSPSLFTLCLKFRLQLILFKPKHSPIQM